MPKSKHSETAIIAALQQMDAGRTAAEVGRDVGVSAATIYSWKELLRWLVRNDLSRDHVSIAWPFTGERSSKSELAPRHGCELRLTASPFTLDLDCPVVLGSRATRLFTGADINPVFQATICPLSVIVLMAIEMLHSLRNPLKTADSWRQECCS